MQRRNVYASMAAQWFSVVFGFIASVLVARMMMPVEFGVFAVTSAILAILSNYQTSIGEYLIYAKEADLGARRSLFGFTLIISVLSMLAILAGRPLLVYFFENPGVADVATVLPLTLLFGLFAVPIQNMLAREERFQIISIAMAVQAIVLGASQIVLVWLGYSYMGLAYAAVLGIAAQWLTMLALAPEHSLWRPSFRGLRKVASFGSLMMGTNIVTNMLTQSGQLLIGAVGTVAQAALFNRAGLIGQLYSRTIPRAIDPLIRARIGAVHRAGHDGLPTILQTSQYTLTVAIWFFGFAAIAADPMVSLIYGEQWAGAAPAMTILSISMIFLPINSPAAAYLTASGQLPRLFRIRLFNLVLRVVLLLAMAPHGLVMATYAILISQVFNTLQVQYTMIHHCKVDGAAFLKGLVMPLVGGIGPVALVLVASLALRAVGMSGWSLLGTLAAIMAVASLLATILTRHPLIEEIGLLSRKLLHRQGHGEG